MKYADHDKVLALTVRVLSGTRTAPPGSGGGQREAVLHVELTDELDPFFLYTLQVMRGSSLTFSIPHVCSASGST